MTDYLKHRLAMVFDLEQRGIKNKRILDAFLNIPREEFVPTEYKKNAYYDGPLPIGSNQTISQPYIVALMTQMLEVRKSDIVLEVGTGSGYQSAILSRLAKKVISVEIIPKLVDFAKDNHSRCNIKNTEIYFHDGTLSLNQKFDRIIITAASQRLVKSWVEELKDGGILIVPEGDPDYQYLKRYRKIKGKLILEDMSVPVRFVPLTGKNK